MKGYPSTRKKGLLRCWEYAAYVLCNQPAMFLGAFGVIALHTLLLAYLYPYYAPFFFFEKPITLFSTACLPGLLYFFFGLPTGMILTASFGASILKAYNQQQKRGLSVLFEDGKQGLKLFFFQGLGIIFTCWMVSFWGQLFLRYLRSLCPHWGLTLFLVKCFLLLLFASFLIEYLRGYNWALYLYITRNIDHQKALEISNKLVKHESARLKWYRFLLSFPLLLLPLLVGLFSSLLKVNWELFLADWWLKWSFIVVWKATFIGFVIARIFFYMALSEDQEE